MTDRFKILLDQLHLSPSGFADKIGVQRSSISHIVSGRNKPSIDFLEKILAVFPEIDVTWLITGKNSVKQPAIQAKSVAEPDLFQELDVRVKSDQEITIPVRNEERKISELPAEDKSIDKIILVFNDNTFRLLEPSER